MVQENPLLWAEKSWDIEKAILRAVENPENPGKILSQVVGPESRSYGDMFLELGISPSSVIQ